MGFEFSDEHLLTTQCDGDATSNRNRILALIDGDDWRGTKAVSERFVFRNDGPRLRRQKFLLLGRKAPVSANPLFIYDSKVGDEHLLPTQRHGHAQSCHVPAARNLNCPSAITDGSLRHALLPPVGSARPLRPDRTGHPRSRLNPRFLLKRVFSGLGIVSQRKLSLHWVRPKTLRRRPLPLGGNDPAAIGAGLGAIDPLRVSQLCREVTSWRVSQHRAVVLNYIPGYAFSVPELTLAFNRPNYHTVKLHSLPLFVPYQITPVHELLRGSDRPVFLQLFQPPGAAPTPHPSSSSRPRPRPPARPISDPVLP